MTRAGHTERMDDHESPDDGAAPVAVCVLRLTRQGPDVRVSVSVAADVRSPDVDRFETTDLEAAFDAVRHTADRMRPPQP